MTDKVSLDAAAAVVVSLAEESAVAKGYADSFDADASDLSLSAELVSDCTFPCGSSVLCGASFVKAWLVRKVC
jgi:hypothetical protein